MDGHQSSCSKNVQPYLSFATQDRQEDDTLLMKQTAKSKDKTLTYKPGYYMERKEDNTLGDSTHTGGEQRGYITAERGAYILTRSPSLSVMSGSLFRGEKWQTQLLTETLVGKAMPRRGKREPPSLHLEIIHKFSKKTIQAWTE